MISSRQRAGGDESTPKAELLPLDCWWHVSRSSGGLRYILHNTYLFGQPTRPEGYLVYLLNV